MLQRQHHLSTSGGTVIYRCEVILNKFLKNTKTYNELNPLTSIFCVSKVWYIIPPCRRAEGIHEWATLLHWGPWFYMTMNEGTVVYSKSSPHVYQMCFSPLQKIVPGKYTVHSCCWNLQCPAVSGNHWAVWLDFDLFMGFADSNKI